MLRFWLRLWLISSLHHLCQVESFLLFFLDIFLFLLVDLLHARLRALLFLFALIFLFKFLLGLLVSPVVIPEMPTVPLIMFQPFKPVVHIVLSYLNRMPNILLIGFLEQKILLMIVTLSPYCNVRRHHYVTPVPSHQTSCPILFLPTRSIAGQSSVGLCVPTEALFKG